MIPKGYLFAFHWHFAWPIQTWCSNNSHFLPTKYKYIHVSFTIHAVLYNKKLQKISHLLKLYFVDINLLEKMLFICFKVQISMAFWKYTVHCTLACCSNWWIIILFYDISDEEDLDEEVRFPFKNLCCFVTSIIRCFIITFKLIDLMWSPQLLIKPWL